MSSLPHPPARTPRRPFRHPLAVLAAGSVLMLAAACGGSGFNDNSAGGSAPQGDGKLTIMIGSSGDAETKAVQDAVATWAQQSGTQAEVLAASDLNQQLSQGFASGNPPDVFYLSTDQLGGYAANGALLPYGDDLPNAGDFYPNLKQAFTVDGKFYCAPKDFSTLALWINKSMWSQAGLTDADIPTTWDQLAAVSAKLTDGDRPGLAFSPEYQRVGAFFPQAGGAMTNAEQTEATVDSPQNVQALEYVKGLLSDGVAKYSSDLGAGWGGEAFGTGKTAMTIEGNWLIGAMASDYADVEYTVAKLPAGPAGEGTLAFTNCWGIPQATGDSQAAISLVNYLTAPEQQTAFAKAFGVIPSVQSAAEQYGNDEPGVMPFIEGAAFAQNPPSTVGAADVITDFNSQLEGLRTGDPQRILASVQQSLQATVKS